MPNELASKTDQDRPFVYEIKINGHLSPQWTDWFEGQSVILEEDGNTLITGLVVDQAALHGLLKKIRDLALPLVSVNRIDSASPAPEEPAPKDVIHDGLPAANFSPTFIDEEDDLNTKEKRRMDSLVSTDWLSQHLDDPDLVVLDCTVLAKPGGEHGFRIVSGREDYEAGHIPGAGFADLIEDLSDRDSPFWMAMPTPEQFCSSMGALGVGDDSRVVLYDGNRTMWAARVWWMLRWVGFDQAAVLDGGFKTWTAEGRPLSTEPPIRPAKQLTLSLRPEVLADRDEVFAALDEESICIIDTLDANSYRARHIPGASHLDARDLLDESGCYRPHDELVALFPGDRTARKITYCGGGVAASSNAFIMTRLGFTNVAVYAASLQEWAADPTNPLVFENPEATLSPYKLPRK